MHLFVEWLIGVFGLGESDYGASVAYSGGTGVASINVKVKSPH